MARSFRKYPFGTFKLRMGKWYRIVEIKRPNGGSSGGVRTVITEFFPGRDFSKYEKFFPEKLGSSISYQVERVIHVPGTHVVTGTNVPKN